MQHLTVGMFTFLLLSGFTASFVDSTVGGGGLISLPALLFTGMPPALAIGTNKLAGTMCSFTSTMSFLHSKKVRLNLVKYLFPLSFLGSIGGAELVHFLPTAFLRPLVIVLLLVVTVYTLLKKNIGMTSTYKGITAKLLFALAAIALALGFYDGFFGPGTGSFLVFLFVFAGFDFVEASGNAKLLNFGSNIGALLTFLVLRNIDYEYGLVMGIGMVIGAIVGSQVAIRKGAAYVRPIFIIVTVLLIGKQIWTLF